MDAMLLVRQKGLARMNSSGRTDKHRHILDDALGLARDQRAVLAVVMLRGPQSAGELKTRTERYSTSHGTGFESIDDIDAVLVRLAEGVGPLAANIGRASGQSQGRWAHLLGDGVPDLHDDLRDVAPGRKLNPPTSGHRWHSAWRTWRRGLRCWNQNWACPWSRRPKASTIRTEGIHPGDRSHFQSG